MTAILEAQDLAKRYPKVNGVSFSLEEGVCFGLLGPNGAGKTTTVEMLEGLTPPSGGAVLFRGKPLGHDYKQEAGIQFQSTVLQDFLTTREALELFSAFYTRTVPVDELIELCALGSFQHQDNRKLSGGQRQRLYLALALLNDPAVLFLDEPTTGLDPQARQNFWQLVQGIKARGKTILLTTHYMEEASVLCDEIAIMDQGRIISQGHPQEMLRAQYQGVWLELPKQAFAPAADFPWKWMEHGDFVEIETTSVNDTLRHLMQQNVSLTGLRVRNPTLEDLFLDLTGRALRS
jgi:ABC-2 type transport system ATP-binding protein